MYPKSERELLIVYEDIKRNYINFLLICMNWHMKLNQYWRLKLTHHNQKVGAADERLSYIKFRL